jgi:hypothetical protein
MRDGQSYQRSRAAPDQRVVHVVGQDQEALDQRGRQHGDHGERDVGDHVAEAAADDDQPGEGGDRGDRGGEDRQRHARRGVLGRLGGRLAQVAVAVVGVFAHDDGVVDHDAQRDDQREQRDHVEAHAGGVHHGDGREHRDGMPAATQKAVRALRNRNSSSTTSPSPIRPLRSRSSSRPEMTSARACTSSIRTPSGRCQVLGGQALDRGLDADRIARLRAVDAQHDRLVLPTK